MPPRTDHPAELLPSNSNRPRARMTDMGTMQEACTWPSLEHLFGDLFDTPKYLLDIEMTVRHEWRGTSQSLSS